MLHCILSKLPKPLDLDALIARSAALHAAHPPNNLSGRLSWHRSVISPNSVLKTTRDPCALAAQTLQQGEAFFVRHAAEIAAQELRQRQFERARLVAKRYKRPAMVAGTAVLAVLLAFYLRRAGGGGGGAAVGSLAGLWRAGLVLRSRAAGLVERALR